ncbi:MAG: insulinase family protein [Flavobacteriaceae bacterium]|nr:insulinase family protein [Flavobacteriaceae bacterium]
MKKVVLSILVVVFSLALGKAQENSFKTYKLKNGLTVVLDADTTQSMVYGIVGVNAGSQDEEPNATGMAHYLEHMLFKGTQTLGTSDWEKEKPLIEEITKLYDDLQKTTTEEEQKAIYKKINEVSQKASEYAIPNEFSKLIQQMGGVALNATTDYDGTRYFNAFPPNQLERWLDLYSHRFEKPVFRLFQTELEAVYEEKNRSDDNPNQTYAHELFKAVFDGHPYARPIIGHTAHLKKPWLSKMQEFFDKWYVPNNMVLILSGNFEIPQAEKWIAEKFGKWESKPIPQRNNLKIKPFEKMVEKEVEVTNFLKGEIVYKGIPSDNVKEMLALEVASEILSNSAQTGLLDKLELNGDAMYVGASVESLKDCALFDISYAPVFDANQRRQMSFSSVEDPIHMSLTTLKKGTYPLWLFEQVKQNMIKDYKLFLESPRNRAKALEDCFVKGKDFNSIFNVEEQLKEISKEDVANVAKKYLGDNYLLFHSEKGEADKEKIKKPSIDPIKPKKHEPSQYAKKFKEIPTTPTEHHFVDLKKEVTAVPFQDKVNLFYVKNKRNDVFTMNVIFHAGTHKFPKLKYAVALMNNAGVMGQYKPDELRKEMGKLGLTYRFSASQDYTIINLQGREDKLAEACQLISRLMLLPKIEDKSLDRIVGSEYYGRMMEKERVGMQTGALVQYILYGDKSSTIDRMPLRELMSVSPTDLTGEFSKATAYNADIHYYGKLSLGQVRYILKKNLAFASNRIIGTSPELKPKKEYKENTIFLVKNKKATQNQVFVYVGGNPISLEKRPVVDAFNEYFGGGFNGLVIKEIREYRSLAYSAGASFDTPLIPSWKGCLIGQIGTQADKTDESVKVMVDLLQNMPEYEDRMSSIKDYLLNSSYLARPSDRNLSFSIYNWALAGYQDDPVKFELPYYQKMTFEDIMNFYKQEIKGKPLVIGIVGDTRKVDKDELEKIGKVKEISVKKLFSKK